MYIYQEMKSAKMIKIALQPLWSSKRVVFKNRKFYFTIKVKVGNILLN